MTTGQHLHPRALSGDPDHDGYVLTTFDGVPQWGPGGGLLDSIVAGDNVTVDDTDPRNPVVSTSQLIHLVAVIGGEPELVWDQDNEQVLMELLP